MTLRAGQPASTRVDGAPPDAVEPGGGEPPLHHAPQGFADHFALGLTKLPRLVSDAIVAQRYGHRASVPETVAAVPGMVGAALTHLR